MIGLSTALLLQVKGYKVTIYARDLPPDTTSNAAGALWDPVSVYEENKAGYEFLNRMSMKVKGSLKDTRQSLIR